MLNLGLESLANNNNVGPTNVIAYTPASAMAMESASVAINELMTSLENYYDAAKNAMAIRRAVKQYGKTQSLVALVGQEGLAVAQSFSMEGFWEKVKNVLLAIWMKIKEWWNRFWGLFFSMDKKAKAAMSEFKKGGRLKKPIEFDGVTASTLQKQMKDAEDVATAIELISNKADFNDNATIDMLREQIGKYATGNHGSAADPTAVTINAEHIKLDTCAAVAQELSVLLDVSKRTNKLKPKIDKYVDKAIKYINKSVRPAKEVSAEDKATNQVLDELVKVLKTAAKADKAVVEKVAGACTKMMAILSSKTNLIEK